MHNMWCDSMSTHTNEPGLPPHSYSTDPCRTHLQRETQRERYLKGTVHPKMKMIISHHHIILSIIRIYKPNEKTEIYTDDLAFDQIERL